MRFWSPRHLVLLFIPVAAGCAALSRHSGEASASGERPLRADSLARALAAVRGEFREVGEPAFVLLPASQADAEVLAAAGAANARAVPALVECIGASREAAVTYAERAVPLGVVCFWVLLQTAWFEQYNERQEWPDGFMHTAWVDYRRRDPAALERARAMWRRYVAEQPLGRP